NGTYSLAYGNHAYNAGLKISQPGGANNYTVDASTNPNVTISTFTVNADLGTLNAGSGNWTILNSMLLSSSTFNPHGSCIPVGGNLAISTATTFNAGTSTVAFNGSSQQNVISSSRTYAALSVLNTSAGGVRFLDSLTVSTFTALQQATTIQFFGNTTS